MPGVTDAGFDRQHYAFLVTETEFDDIFARIRGQEPALLVRSDAP